MGGVNRQMHRAMRAERLRREAAASEARDRVLRAYRNGYGDGVAKAPKSVHLPETLRREIEFRAAQEIAVTMARKVVDQAGDIPFTFVAEVARKCWDALRLGAFDGRLRLSDGFMIAGGFVDYQVDRLCNERGDVTVTVEVAPLRIDLRVPREVIQVARQG